MHPEPLQPGQNRRQLVSAPAGQANLFNGRNLEIGLGLIVVTHGGSGTRMLQVQTRKPPRTLNHHANIRTDKPTPNSMMTRVQEAGFQPLNRKISRPLVTSFLRPHELHRAATRGVEYLRIRNCPSPPRSL